MYQLVHLGLPIPAGSLGLWIGNRRCLTGLKISCDGIEFNLIHARATRICAHCTLKFTCFVDPKEEMGRNFVQQIYSHICHP
ncbi:hypothetical protein ACFX2I_024046 [Malus domestica]